jgi:DHA1 family tetracycline resistance protein-like MFS transporter
LRGVRQGSCVDWRSTWGVAASAHDREVIAIRGDVHNWIEPWHGADAILGALTSGLAVISLPLVVINGGGTALQIGTAIAVQNIGALFAPLWGMVADRTGAYRSVFFTGFVLIGLGFLGFTILRGLSTWISCAFLLGFGTGASNTVASLFEVEFTPKGEWSQRISWLAGSRGGALRTCRE